MSNNYIFYFSCNLFYDEPVSFFFFFFCNFHFPSSFLYFGCFRPAIGHVPNLKMLFSVFYGRVRSPCIFANLEIHGVNKNQRLLFKKLWFCLIILSNCSTFFNGNFYVIRNSFTIAFLYINIWIVCGIIFCYFVVPGFI